MTNSPFTTADRLHNRNLLSLNYQLFFWLVYTLFWHSIFSPDFWSWQGFTTSLLYTLVHASASYTNILWLIPKLWNRSRLAYFLALLFLILSSSALLAGLLYLWLGALSPTGATTFFSIPGLAIGSTLGSTFSGVVMSMGIYLLLHKRKLEQRQQQLEKEKMRAELQFLRQQIDPHFLFNVLNNIYFLIKKDPDAAAEALAGFSELLRYQIYQTQTDTIPLAEEFEYLCKYANLASLRLPKDAQIEVQLNPPDKALRIPPLLLLPLIENAFKHVDKDRPTIKAVASIAGQSLQLKVSNSRGSKVVSSEGDPKPSGGVGLDNLDKRLKLLYPQQHELHIEQSPEMYSVSLKIELR